MSEGEVSKSIAWNSRLEEYFSSTGEKAHCLSWIHKQAETLYSRRKTFIDLPVIVFSGVLGFLSVGSSSMFAGDESTASIAVGVGSLFVSVLNTIGSYFQWAKRAEGHRIASIQYAKLYRFLTIEMSLPRDERMSPADLLKLTKETYDRLAEISPLAPPEIIDDFRKKFGGEKDISKPEEANGLEKIIVYTPSTGNIAESHQGVAFENPLPRLRTPVPTLKGSRLNRGTAVGSSPALDSPPIGLPSPSPRLQPLSQAVSESSVSLPAISLDLPSSALPPSSDAGRG